MASRYWVGGTGNWDASDTTHWSATSGGGGGASVPGAADAVIFNALSGTGTCTSTVTSPGTIASLAFTGYTGSFSCSNLFVSGVVILASGMTWATANTLYVGGNLTTAGKTIPGSLTFGSTNRSFAANCTLQDAVTVAGNLTIESGSLNTNSKAVTVQYGSGLNGSFTIDGSGTVTLGTSTITCNQFSVSTWFAGTLSAASSSLVLAGDASWSTALSSNAIGGITPSFGSVSMTGYDMAMSPINCTSLSITGGAGKTPSFRCVGTITCSGAVTINGNSLTNRLLVTQSTFSVAQNPTSQYADFESVIVTGGTLSGTSIGDCGGNTGVTATAAVTRYAKAAGNWSATATWSATDGGTAGASVPLVHDTVYLTANAGAGTYTVDMPRIAGINCAGFTRTLAIGMDSQSYGSVTLSSGMTLTPGTYSFYVGHPTAALTLTSSGKQFYFLGPRGAQMTLNDAVVVTSYFSAYIATFNANDQNITAPRISTQATTLSMGSGTWTCSGDSLTNGGQLNISAGTINKGTANVVMSSTTASSNRSVSISAGSGGGIYKLTIGGGAAANQTTTIAADCRIDWLASTKTVAHTLAVASGKTLTIAVGITAAGSPGNLLGITGNVSAATTNPLVVDYGSISNSAATPANRWYAPRSTDGGGNTGWLFRAPSFGQLFMHGTF